ncbi:hypothetical protein GOBAR_DD25763 [Gossypium barbadense]|nr:hypothetical protein GOBAR_DD25763 [Gossypium barbadense]
MKDYKLVEGAIYLDGDVHHLREAASLVDHGQWYSLAVLGRIGKIEAAPVSLPAGEMTVETLIVPVLLDHLLEPNLGVNESAAPLDILNLPISSSLMVQKAIDLTFPADPPSVTISHFNTTFEGSVESVVELSAGVLDPKRHSTIFFIENANPKSINSTRNIGLIKAGKGHLASKERSSGNTVNFMVTFINSQIGIETGNEVLNSDGKS